MTNQQLENLKIHQAFDAQEKREKIIIAVMSAITLILVLASFAIESI